MPAVSPPQVTSPQGDVFGECGQKTFSRGGRNFLSLPLLRFVDACAFQKGGDEINDVTGRMTSLAPRLNAGRPMGDEGGADSTFVDPGLVSAKRSIPGA